MDTDKRILTDELLDFISECPVSYVAVDTITRRLEQSGFVCLQEQETWSLQAGGKYFVTRNQSSVLAFCLPRIRPNGFMIAASHCDSPGFCLKHEYETVGAESYLKLNTERYGGGILSSWFDRPLSLAGRVVIRDGASLRAVPIDLKDPLCVIPSVAIHLNRGVNDGYKYNAAVDTIPLYGEIAHKGHLKKCIAKRLNVPEENIVSQDMYVYCAERGRQFGAEEAFFLAPRIDDLQCAFASLRALMDCRDFSSVPVCAVFDNEEVGSSTKQGAASDLLQEVLKRISYHYDTDLRRMLIDSLMLSCDNGHAVHPNHPELSDTKNGPRLNGGVVIKHNANQKYTTDAVSEALFAAIADRAEIPIQHYANRSDLPGGSTLGNISNTKVSLNTADIGLAQLGMHSCMETGGSDDTAHLYRALLTFYQSSITASADGNYRLQ